MDLHLSPDTSKTLLWLLTMLLIDYAAVIIAVVIDLRSGLRRARREGQPLTSGGYRRSVDKCLRYLLTLMAFTTVDAMILFSLFGSQCHVLPLSCGDLFDVNSFCGVFVEV